MFKHIGYLLAVVFICTAPVASAAGSGNPPPKEGRLIRWSDQKDLLSKKVIIFVHGANLNSSVTGEGWERGEVRFDLKMRNLNWLGEETLHNPTSNLAEFWVYNYNPQQSITKIANDLRSAIQNCSDFDGSQIAVIGHSQGGVVVWELVQQYPTLVDGGICLGAPILSTPLVHKEVRDQAVQKTFRHSWSVLIPKFDDLAKGTNQLEFHRQAPNELPGNLYLFAGSISTTRIKWALIWPWNLKHYIDLIDVIVTAGHNFFTGLQDDRQFLEITADLIEKSDWSNNSRWDHLNDGLVPVSSALAGATETDDRHFLFKCDHSELLSGQGDLTLDRMILDCLVKILDLTPHETVSDPGLPKLPDRLEIFTNGICPLQWARFAYVKSEDKQIYLTDANWQQTHILPVNGECSYPEFNPKKLGMTFTVNWQNHSNIYLFDEKQLCAIVPDNQSRCSSFSPNGRWIAYQSGDELMIYNLKSRKRHSLVKGINLASPPIWVAEWLTGKVYFAHRNQGGRVDIYCVSPRWRRTRNIDELQPIVVDAGVPHIVRGYLGGIVATQSEWDSSGNLVCQRINFISGILKGHYSLEIRATNENSSITLDGNMLNKQILIETNRGLRFESALLDRDYLQLYLVDKEGDSPSIYRFDYALINAGEGATFETVLSEIVPGALQVDINRLAE